MNNMCENICEMRRSGTMPTSEQYNDQFFSFYDAINTSSDSGRYVIDPVDKINLMRSGTDILQGAGLEDENGERLIGDIYDEILRV